MDSTKAVLTASHWDLMLVDSMGICSAGHSVGRLGRPLVAQWALTTEVCLAHWRADHSASMWVEARALWLVVRWGDWTAANWVLMMEDLWAAHWVAMKVRSRVGNSADMKAHSKAVTKEIPKAGQSVGLRAPRSVATRAVCWENLTAGMTGQPRDVLRAD
jgi:hypothetical protein